jgi:hypothetical protein
MKEDYIPDMNSDRLRRITLGLASRPSMEWWIRLRRISSLRSSVCYEELTTNEHHSIQY